MKSNDKLKLQGIMIKGYGIIPKLVMQDKRLSRDAKCIYSYFCSFAGAGDSQVFPSVKKICHDLDFGSEKTFRKHMELLIKNGYITKTKNREDDGKFFNNVYTLNSKVEEHLSIVQNLHHGKFASRQKCTTNNNNNLNNNKQANNNNKEPENNVVVDKKYIDFFMKEFKEKYGHNFNKERLIELYKLKGEKILEKYLKDYQKVIDSKEIIKSIPGLFYSFVKYGWTVSEVLKNLKHNKPAQSLNYEQRQYDDEFFNSLYDNI